MVMADLETKETTMITIFIFFALFSDFTFHFFDNLHFYFYSSFFMETKSNLAIFLQTNLFSRLSFFPFWLSIGIPHRRHLDIHFYHSAIIHRQTFLQIKN